MILNEKKIVELFHEINTGLHRLDIRGEVVIVGGAAMCLAFKARPSTRDVDAIFAPTSKIRKLAADLAEEHRLPPDWLNDAVKRFLSPKIEKNIFLELSNLRIYTATADTILAMKAISARFDASDQDDLKFLIRFLKLKTAKQVFEIIEHYYPKHEIPTKIQYFVEEIMAP